MIKGTSKIAQLQELWEALDTWMEAPSSRAAIEQQIVERWRADKSILITDLSGCSRITREYGIIHFMALVRKSHALYFPIIEAHGGIVIDIIADDLILAFDTADDALQTGVEMHCATRDYNRNQPVEYRIGLGLGIECGSLLNINDVDYFGDAINVASKLGEDLADRGELLTGPSARDRYCSTPRCRSAL